MSFERRFESLLWSSRLVVLVAVVGSLMVALAMFYVATMDVLYLITHLGEYGNLAMAADARAALRGQTVAHVVEVVDGYLLAAIMLIFSLGLYELFVSRIDIAEGSEFAERLLLIRSLDDLKDRLAKVVLLILVVRFFEYALGLPITEPLDLLYLAIGIVAVAAALALSNKTKNPSAAPAAPGDGYAG
jgi:uncharacterized membrane protein YqhA